MSRPHYLTPEHHENIIIDNVRSERDHQDRLWGPLPRGLSNGHWLAVLTEEVGEVAREIVENPERATLPIVNELVQVAAVAQAWAADLLLEVTLNVDVER